MYSLALVAHVVLQAVGLDARVAAVAERAARVLDEAGVGQLHVALLAAEARRVPVRVHRLDHAPDYELAWGSVLGLACFLF